MIKKSSCIASLFDVVFVEHETNFDLMRRSIYPKNTLNRKGKIINTKHYYIFR